MLIIFHNITAFVSNKCSFGEHKETFKQFKNPIDHKKYETVSFTLIMYLYVSLTLSDVESSGFGLSDPVPIARGCGGQSADRRPGGGDRGETEGKNRALSGI